MVIQILVGLQALALAVLTLTDTVQPWHLVVLSLLLGAFYAIDAPIRQSLPIHLIRDGRDLTNAIGLVAVTTNTARMAGPAIGGVLVGLVGEAGCFLVNAASYFAVYLCISMLHLPHQPRQEKSNAWQSMKEGMTYAARTPTIRLMLGFAAAVAFFATAYLTLMPYFAREVFGAGPELLGLLLGAAGIGSLAGSFYLAIYKRVDRLPRSMAAAVMVTGVALACFPFTGQPWLGALVLVPVGFGVVFCANGANTLLQSLVRNELRGRVMALFVMLYYGVMPLGSLATGALADVFGAPAALASFGLITVCVAVIMLRLANRMTWRH